MEQKTFNNRIIFAGAKQIKISEEFKFILNGHKFDFLHDLTKRCKWLSATQKKKVHFFFEFIFSWKLTKLIKLSEEEKKKIV